MRIAMVLNAIPVNLHFASENLYKKVAAYPLSALTLTLSQRARGLMNKK